MELFPYKGSNLHTLRWQYRVVTTGPPGKSLSFLICFFNVLLCKTLLSTTAFTFCLPQLTFHSYQILHFLFLWSLTRLAPPHRKCREDDGTPLQYSCLEKSHGRRSLVGCSPWGRYDSDTTERLHFHFSLSCIGEGNGNPLQCSCLENPRAGGAWWPAIYGVTQSRIWLKRRSSSSSSSSSSSR